MFVWSGLISGYDLANEEQQRGRKLKKSPADIRGSYAGSTVWIPGQLYVFGLKHLGQITGLKKRPQN